MSSSFNVLSDLGAVHQTGQSRLDDPGAGGTIRLDGRSGMICLCTGGGVRKLADDDFGMELTIFSMGGTLAIQNAAGSEITELTDGKGARLQTKGSGMWCAFTDAIGGGSVISNDFADITVDSATRNTIRSYGSTMAGSGQLVTEAALYEAIEAIDVGELDLTTLTDGLRIRGDANCSYVISTSETAAETVIIAPWDVNGSALGTSRITMTAANAPTLDIVADAVTVASLNSHTPSSLGLDLLAVADAAAGRTLLGVTESGAVYAPGGTDVAVTDGGTGASTASGARTNLGLGTLATASTVNNGEWSGTDLAVVNGGTGASTASDARTNLGLVIGSNVQAQSSVLTTYAGHPPSSAVESLLDSANAAEARTNLGLAIGSNVQAYSAGLSVWAAINPAANVQTFLAAADYSAMRTQLSLVVGTHVQAYDADLASLASGITGIVRGAGNGGGYSAATAGTDYVSPTTWSNDRTSMTLTTLTLEPMDPISGNPTKGLTVGVGQSNASKLNAYWNADFRTSWLPVEVPMRGYIFADTLYTGATNSVAQYSQVFGRCIRGSGGQGYPLSELQIQPASCSIGGETSRLVVRDKSDLDNITGAGRTFMVVDSYGLTIEGALNIWGAWSAGDNANSITWDYPSPNGALSDGTLSFAQAATLYPDVGILITGQKAAGIGIGNGKLNAQSLAMFGFNTAIQCGEEWDIDNADQIRIDDFRAIYCHEGIRLVTQQSLGHHIGLYEGIHVLKMLVVERGGKVTGDQWTVETPDCVMVESHTPQAAESGYIFQKVTIDGNAGAGCIVWDQRYTELNPDDPPGPTGPNEPGTGGGETMTIMQLHCHPGVTYTDCFRLGPWANLNILSGIGLSAGMLKFTGGIDTHKPVVRLVGCEIDITSPTDIVSGSSSGAYTVHMIDCHKPGGVRIPSRSWTKDQSAVTTILGPQIFANTYSVTGGSTDRALNAASPTDADTANVLGTLITDLKAAGVIPAA